MLKLSDNDRIELELIASGSSGAEFTQDQIEVLYKHYNEIKKIPQGVTWMNLESFCGWLRKQLTEEYNNGLVHQMLINL